VVSGWGRWTEEEGGATSCQRKEEPRRKEEGDWGDRASRDSRVLTKRSKCWRCKAYLPPMIGKGCLAAQCFGSPKQAFGSVFFHVEAKNGQPLLVHRHTTTSECLAKIGE
jgi:hypothetical protein